VGNQAGGTANQEKKKQGSKEKQRGGEIENAEAPESKASEGVTPVSDPQGGNVDALGTRDARGARWRGKTKKSNAI